MENTPQNTALAAGSSKKWLYLSLAGVGAVAMILLWVFYIGPDAQRTRELDRNYDIAMNTIATFEEAMRNDTYGGETPQETLELFIHALNKGDMDLAAKYFVLETNGFQDQETVEGLYKAKENGEIPTIVKYLSEAEPYEEDRINEDYYNFVVYDENKEIIVYISMRKNTYSNVWKIESL